MDLTQIDPASVHNDTVDACSGKDNATIESIIKALNEEKSEHAIATNQYKYSLGIALSQGAFDKLKGAKPALIEKYPPLVVEVPRVTLDSDGNVKKTTVKRYSSLTPIGSGELPLAEVSELEALTVHANLKEDDIKALEALRIAVDTATSVQELKAAMFNLAAKEAELLGQYKIAQNLFVLRTAMNVAVKTSAEAKLEKAQLELRFVQMKLQALKSVLAERAAKKANRAAMERADWMNGTGKTLVMKALGIE